MDFPVSIKEPPLKLLLYKPFCTIPSGRGHHATPPRLPRFLLSCSCLGELTVNSPSIYHLHAGDLHGDQGRDRRCREQLHLRVQPGLRLKLCQGVGLPVSVCVCFCWFLCFLFVFFVVVFATQALPRCTGSRVGLPVSQMSMESKPSRTLS